ncbi:MAG: integration host factor subunit alpha [Nitrospinae bacterium]|nr:integration host factor subunit alpha [Nitrospinota bacterium]
MVKTDIVDLVYEKVGFTKKEASDAVDILFDSMKDILAQGEDIHIVGFGSFNLRNKHERIGRNPKTGEEIIITHRRVLTFKPSRILRDLVNQR